MNRMGGGSCLSALKRYPLRLTAKAVSKLEPIRSRIRKTKCLILLLLSRRPRVRQVRVCSEARLLYYLTLELTRPP